MVLQFGCPFTRPLRILAQLGLLVATSMAEAQAPPSEAGESEKTVLPPVVVTAPPPVAASSELLLPGRDFELRPQGRPADVLRLAPGLVISQHAGGGMFGTQRYLTLLSPTRDALKTLVAVEGFVTDGPFERGQNFQRFNGFAKASATLAEGTDLSFSASHYRSAWHASGQIPERGVRAGLIDRFGAIDNSEGGQTQRTNVQAELRWRPSEGELVTVRPYLTYYALDLFSDFTFFLNDPVNGDGIEQVDRRVLAGLDAQYQHRAAPLGLPLTSTTGFQYRIDAVHVVLLSQTDVDRVDPILEPGGARQGQPQGGGAVLILRVQARQDAAIDLFDAIAVDGVVQEEREVRKEVERVVGEVWTHGDELTLGRSPAELGLHVRPLSLAPFAVVDRAEPVDQPGPHPPLGNLPRGVPGASIV